LHVFISIRFIFKVLFKIALGASTLYPLMYVGYCQPDAYCAKHCAKSKTQDEVYRNLNHPLLGLLLVVSASYHVVSHNSKAKCVTNYQWKVPGHNAVDHPKEVAGTDKVFHGINFL